MHSKSTLITRLTAGAKAAKGSYVAIAFALLCLVDVTARFVYPALHVDPYIYPNRSYVWWATKQLRESPGNPDVVLLGSSLMMSALHGGDATFLNTPQQMLLHNRASYLEHLFQRQGGERTSVFAFAIGGQMASDAYVISSTVLTERRPKVIVYGIAPRDFMDNTLTNPASTETFRYMYKVGQLKDLAAAVETTFWGQVELLAQRVSFVYDKRPDLVYFQNQVVRHTLAGLLHDRSEDLVLSPAPLRKIATAQLPEDLGPNEAIMTPFTGGKYHDNSIEYKKRYQAFRKDVFEKQLSFLEKLLQHCRQEGILLVLVNMPLTEDNVALMPPGLYDTYLQSVGGLAQKYHGTLLNLNKPALFPRHLFADSVHLNGWGGMRFFEVLAPLLMQDAKVAATKNGITR